MPISVEGAGTSASAGAVPPGRLELPGGMRLPAALPVALALLGTHRDAVGRWVEGTLGWQVVASSDGLAVDDPVPPVLRLRDHATATRAGAGGEQAAPWALPEILVVADDVPPVTAAVLAQAAPSTPVLGWPSQRDQLPELAAAVLAVPAARSGTTSVLVVGGSAGGVGTTTIALALAGLKAWSGWTTLAAVRGLGLPWRRVPVAALADSDLWNGADPLPGLEAARVVCLTDHAPLPDLTDQRIETIVVDGGATPDCDVLVCRPDAAGLWALERTTAAAVVLVGDGPVPARALRRAVAGRRVIRLPYSARVARAGAAHRLPAGLPGLWIASLRPLLTGRSAAVRDTGARAGDGGAWGARARAAPDAGTDAGSDVGGAIDGDRTRGPDRHEAWTTR